MPDADTSSITDPVARLIAPLSTSTVSQHEPTLHWVLTPQMTNPVVDLCADRACTQPLAISATVLNDHSARPSAPLPAGWVYWRVRATDGSQTFTSPTWQFLVTKHDAFGASFPDTSGGTTFDVNGDGYADVLISAPDASAVYLYLGNATGTNLTRIDLTSPDSLVLGSCNNQGTCFGGELANVGDINGDGFADFGIQSWVTPTQQSGNVYIYLGGPNPDPSQWNGASATKRIDLLHETARYGSITAVGDINGDGYGDFYSQSTRSYGGGGVYCGSRTPEATRWAWNGQTIGPDVINVIPPDRDLSKYMGFGPGTSVGDVNGDGYGDFVVGASPWSSEIHFAFAHLYYGGPTAGAATWNGGAATRRVDIVTQESQLGFGGSFGAAVSGVGDVNGDGYDDFLVGATNGSAAHLYYGGPNRTAADWNNIPDYRADLVSPEGTSFGFGNAVAGVGDVDGDGLADFAIGSPNNHQLTNDGAAHVFLGAGHDDINHWNGSTATQRLDLVTPDGADGFFGTSLGHGGDVDGNGYSDFLICAPRANGFAGACHIDFGSASPDAARWNGTTASARLDLAPPSGGGGFGDAAN